MLPKGLRVHALLKEGGYVGHGFMCASVRSVAPGQLPLTCSGTLRQFGRLTAASQASAFCLLPRRAVDLAQIVPVVGHRWLSAGSATNQIKRLLLGRRQGSPLPVQPTKLTSAAAPAPHMIRHLRMAPHLYSAG